MDRSPLKFVRMFKWTAPAAGLLLLLAGLILGVLHTGPVQAFILSSLQEYLWTRQGIVLQAESLDYNLLKMNFQLVRARLAASPADPPFAEAEELQLEVDTCSLLAGRPRVEALRLTRPSLRLLWDEAGGSNLPSSPAGETTGPRPAGLFPFPLRSLEVQGGSLLWEDRRLGLSLELPAWSARLREEGLGKEHRISFRLDRSGNVVYQGQGVPLQGLSLELRAQGRELSLEALELAFPRSKLAAEGRLGDLYDPVLDLRVVSGLDLGEVLDFFEVEPSVAGTLDGKVHLTGPLDSPRVEAEFESTDLQWHQRQPAHLKLGLNWDSEAGRLGLRPLVFRSSLGDLDGELTLYLDPGAGESHIRLQAANLDLERLSAELGSPVSIASRGRLELEGTWPGLDLLRFRGRGNLRAQSLRAPPKENRLPLAGALALELEPFRARLDLSALEVLGARLQGRLLVHSPRLLEAPAQAQVEGPVKVQIEDLVEVLTQAGAFLGDQSLLPPLPLAGPLQLALQFRGTLEGPSFSSRLQSAGLRVGKLEEVGLQGELDYDGERLRISDTFLRWREQGLHLEGLVSLGPDPSFTLGVRLEDLGIETLLEAARMDWPLGGRLQGELAARGTWQQPQARLSLNVSDLQMFGRPFAALGLEAELAEGQVSLERLSLRQTGEPDGGGSLQAQGRYHLQAGRYAVSLRADDLRLQDLPVPEGISLEGELSLQAEGEGDLDEPLLDLELEVSGLRVEQQIVGDLRAAGSLRGSHWSLEGGVSGMALEFQGSGETAAPYPLQLRVAARDLDLSSLPLPVPEGQTWSGILAGEVRAAGDVQNWREGRVEVRIPRLQASLGGHRVQLESPLRAELTPGQFRLEPLVVSSANSRVEVEGRLSLDRPAPPGEIRVQGDLDLADLAGFFPAAAELDPQGRMVLRGELRGDLQRLEPRLEISLSGGRIQLPAARLPLEDVGLEAGLEEGSLVVRRLGARLGEGTLEARAALPLEFVPPDWPLPFVKAGGPARLQVQVEDLQLGSFRFLPEDISGLVFVGVEAEASRPELESLTARVEFGRLELDLAGYRVAQDSPSRLLLQRGSLQVERFQLSGAGTRVGLQGGTRLGETPLLDLRLEGRADAAMLGLLAGGLQSSGEVRFELEAGGTPGTPRLAGYLEMEGGGWSLTAPRVQAQNVDFRIRLLPDRLEVERFEGELNGGTLQVTGGAGLSGMELGPLDLNAAADGVFLNFPEGLRTSSRARLRLTSQEELIWVAGQVEILEGSYTETLDIESELLNWIRSQRSPEFVDERSPLLSKLRFNVGVSTLHPITLNNNLARLLLTMNLRLVGSYYRPGLTGRIALEEGGQLYLRERTYLVERGVVSFLDETRIEPSLDILARTQVSAGNSYDVSLRVSGDPENLKTTLSSDPPLPEPDILALLLTGRTLEQVRGSELDVLREQALSYLAGGLGTRLGREAGQALGLSQVRIEPSLISPESNPGARLTLGQNLTPDLRLIYSMNLLDSSDQIWVTEYDLTRDFNTRGVKQNDNTYRFEFRHDWRFGERRRGDPPSLQPQREVGQVSFTGRTLFPEDTLRDRFRLQPGDLYDFFRLQKGMERLEKLYRDQDRLESRIRLRRQGTGRQVNLQVEVEAGPQVQFAFEGGSVSWALRKRIREIWSSGVFDFQRGEEALAAIRQSLVRRGYLQPRLDVEVSTPSEEEKRVLFRIEPGTRFRHVELSFQGVSAFSPEFLREQLEEAGLMEDLYLQPDRVVSFLRRKYREEGFLEVRVDSPRYELDAEKGQGQVLIAVEEGPRFQVAGLTFDGNRVFSRQELEQAVPLRVGEPFRPVLQQEAFRRLEELYLRRGYNQVRIEDSLQRREGSDQVEIFFHTEENRQEVIEVIEVEGNNRTSAEFIRRQLSVSPGDVLDHEKTSQSRRSLYDTGAFSLVEIEAEPLAEGREASPVRPVRLVVRVRETRPFELRYGGLFDTERGAGVIADFTNRNSLGSARVLGLRTRFDGDTREVRGYFSQPQLLGFPVSTHVVSFFRRELRPSFLTDRLGFSLQQEALLGNKFVFSYGYRFERNRTVDRTPDPLFDIRLNVAPLTATLTRDTRDDILDATRGSFTSHALEFAPEFLGSDLRFIKYFGQYFQYFPLAAPSEVPFRGGLRRPRVVFASGVRVGLAQGLGGQELILSERFLAGGGTTIRGFQQDTVGPTDFFGDPAGGDAVLILNNELRFPIYSLVDGVAFLDVGNVYSRLSDFDPFDVRKSSGLGLRIRTPYFLLRLDYGVKLERREGESAGALFFSIGQAF